MKKCVTYLLLFVGLFLGPRAGAQEQDSLVSKSASTDPLSLDCPDLVPTEKHRLPFIIAKTNLLFDAATLINVGVEVPVGRKWSVSGDYYFPWWKSVSRNITIRSIAGVVEGRRWLGDRAELPTMEGFYAGVYVGAGYYDFQLGGDGIQGEFFLMGGVSGGYVHEIGKNLRLEYNLGLGYLRTNYREYSPVSTAEYGDIKAREYPWPERRQTWLGPTKVQVSLQWLINTCKCSRKKGGKR